jgi:hypothetical protein
LFGNEAMRTLDIEKTERLLARAKTAADECPEAAVRAEIRSQIAARKKEIADLLALPVWGSA